LDAAHTGGYHKIVDSLKRRDCVDYRHDGKLWRDAYETLREKEPDRINLYEYRLKEGIDIPDSLTKEQQLLATITTRTQMLHASSDRQDRLFKTHVIGIRRAWGYKTFLGWAALPAAPIALMGSLF
jgi:hypothetical protein